MVARLDVPDDLMRGLGVLDRYLVERRATLDILLVGANGMRCLGLVSRASADLDNHNAMADDLRMQIGRIAAELGLPSDWLNDQAADIPLPDGAETRLVKVPSGLTSITFRTLCRIDFVAMKVAAASLRMEDTPRDVQDLKECGVTREEFDAALDYVQRHHRPDDETFAAYQDADIEQLRKVLFDE